MKTNLILIVSALLLSSCNDFLNVTPKGFTIPSKYIDYRYIMNEDSNMAKAQESFPPYLTDDILLGEVTMYQSFAAASEQFRRLYTFEHGAVFPDGVSDDFWLYTYNRIYMNNTVILEVMNSTDGTDEEKRNCRAEALVGRAFEYMCLMGIYAPAYNAETAATDLGVPLIFNIDVADLHYFRHTTAEVYAQIEQDLAEALPDLYDKVPNPFRPAKFVANAFLARMYLMMGNYDKCLERAILSLETSENLIDLKEYTFRPDVSTGRIIHKNTSDRYPEGMNNPENIYVRYMPTVFALNGAVYASEDLLAVYAKDLPEGAVDKRRELWYVDDSFFNYYMFPGYSLYNPGIRVNVGLTNMEMMLTAAECYARKGSADNLKEASRLYNLLRDHRIENNVHVSFTNAEEALVKVLDERRREFAILGSYRIVDLKRLNRDPRFAKTITHTVDGQTFTLPPNDNRYVMPLPPVVKGFRPDLPDIDR